MTSKDKIIDSLTEFVLTTPSTEQQMPYQIYNAWATKNKVVLKDEKMLEFILDYISDIKVLPSTISDDLKR